MEFKSKSLVPFDCTTRQDISLFILKCFGTFICMNNSIAISTMLDSNSQLASLIQASNLFCQWYMPEGSWTYVSIRATSFLLPKLTGGIFLVTAVYSPFCCSQYYEGWRNKHMHQILMCF